MYVPATVLINNNHEIVAINLTIPQSVALLIHIIIVILIIVKIIEMKLKSWIKSKN